MLGGYLFQQTCSWHFSSCILCPQPQDLSLKSSVCGPGLRRRRGRTPLGWSPHSPATKQTEIVGISFKWDTSAMCFTTKDESTFFFCCCFFSKQARVCFLYDVAYQRHRFFFNFKKTINQITSKSKSCGYTKCWFSHDAAHIVQNSQSMLTLN